MVLEASQDEVLISLVFQFLDRIDVLVPHSVSDIFQTIQLLLLCKLLEHLPPLYYK